MRTLISTLIALSLLALLSCSDKTTSPEPTAPPQETQILVGELPADVQEIVTANTPEELNLAPENPQDWPNWPTWPDWLDRDYLANCEVYAVTFLWGDFLGGITPTPTVTDWSGTLSVNGVAVVHPRMTIDFESGEDYMVEEDIPSLAQWVSLTSMDFDGISFLVFNRTDVVYFTAPMLTFATEPISVSFNFEELEKLTKLYMIDNGRALVVHSRKIWPPRCPGGFLEGAWIKEDNAGASGRIEAVWMNAVGEPEGLLTGQFVTNNDGSRTLSGWVSGYITDQIIAEFKGTWWYDDPSMCITCGSGHGWYRGTFVYANGTNQGGTICGEFGRIAATDPTELSLPLRGVWQNFCPFVFEGRGSDVTY
jgi:hypothetical protein